MRQKLLKLDWSTEIDIWFIKNTLSLIWISQRIWNLFSSIKCFLSSIIAVFRSKIWITTKERLKEKDRACVDKHSISPAWAFFIFSIHFFLPFYTSSILLLFIFRFPMLCWKRKCKKVQTILSYFQFSIFFLCLFLRCELFLSIFHFCVFVDMGCYCIVKYG